MNYELQIILCQTIGSLLNFSEFKRKSHEVAIIKVDNIFFRPVRVYALVLFSVYLCLDFEIIRKTVFACYSMSKLAHCG